MDCEFLFKDLWENSSYWLSMNSETFSLFLIQVILPPVLVTYIHVLISTQLNIWKGKHSKLSHIAFFSFVFFPENYGCLSFPRLNNFLNTLRPIGSFWFPQFETTTFKPYLGSNLGWWASLNLLVYLVSEITVQCCLMSVPENHCYVYFVHFSCFRQLCKSDFYLLLLVITHCPEFIHSLIHSTSLKY